MLKAMIARTLAYIVGLETEHYIGWVVRSNLHRPEKKFVTLTRSSLRSHYCLLSLTPFDCLTCFNIFLLKLAMLMIPYASSCYEHRGACQGR